VYAVSWPSVICVAAKKMSLHIVVECSKQIALLNISVEEVAAGAVGYDPATWN
jgi:hypothetical protein